MNTVSIKNALAVFLNYYAQQSLILETRGLEIYSVLNVYQVSS